MILYYYCYAHYSDRYSPSSVVVCWHHCNNHSVLLLHTIGMSYTIGTKRLHKVVMCVLFSFDFDYMKIYSVTVVYEEPYDWAASRLPQTEPVMEQCPAYGVLTK